MSGLGPDPAPEMPASARKWAAALALVSLLAVALRLYAAARVGFGDSEALYASYALHPAPAYLDHPGLIGLVARLFGGGSAPSPVTAHRVTAALATLAPWGVVLASRALRAAWGPALAAGLVTACVPEIAVGLFGMTPDLLLFPLWVGTLGFAGAGLLAPPSSLRAAAFLVFAGVLAGTALAAKVSAAGLVLALAVTYLSRDARAHAHTIWPWVGLTLGAYVFSPVALFEAKAGWPMLHHRLIATQAEAGVSLRNVGTLVGGQLAYLSPLLAVVAVFVARDLWKNRRSDVASTLLANALVAPLALLVPLCLWSRVAEPHWMAPALLGLPLHYARRGALGLGHSGARGLPWQRRFLGAAVGLAAAMSLLVHAWVLVPRLALLVPASAYDARIDISNELYGWPEVIDTVRELASKHHHVEPLGIDPPDGPPELVVVGPHWVVSAQLEAALERELPVGCAGQDAADFAYWNPPERWQDADFVVFVRDNRFADDAPLRFPGRIRIDSRWIDVRRAGHLARSFSVEVLMARGIGREPRTPPATAAPYAIGTTPASRRSERSSSWPGLGVVRSFSP